MKSFLLKRFAENDNGTMGCLFDELNTPLMMTLERKWLDNQKDISSIPDGSYISNRVISPKFGETFEVTQVKDRDNVLIHAGNTISDSQGCMLVGKSLYHLESLMESKLALEKLLNTVKTENSFRLTIKTV